MVRAVALVVWAAPVWVALEWVADYPVQVELIWAAWAALEWADLVWAVARRDSECLIPREQPLRRVGRKVREARAEPREIFPSRAKGPGKPRKQGRDFPGRV